MNIFLETNKIRLNSIRHRMDEFKLRNNTFNNEIPVNDILFLYNGMVNEINKLQEKVDTMKKELDLYKGTTK